jgi:hypothetical protein
MLIYLQTAKIPGTAARGRGAMPSSMGRLTTYLSSPLVFSGIHVARSLVFCVMFYRSLFVLLYFFFWPLCYMYLSFFDSRLLITHLVSSNFSYTILFYFKCIDLIMIKILTGGGRLPWLVLITAFWKFSSCCKSCK